MSVKDFICAALGPGYVADPALDLAGAYADSMPAAPVLFVLGPGGDPSDALQRFARSRGMQHRLVLLSLGRGLGDAAATAVRRAMRAGDWVLLQNCDLAPSWMPELATLVTAAQTAAAARDAALGATFRLWLSTASRPTGRLTQWSSPSACRFVRVW